MLNLSKQLPQTIAGSAFLAVRRALGPGWRKEYNLLKLLIKNDQDALNAVLEGARRAAELERAQRDAQGWLKQGIEVIGILDAEYPALLREVADPPLFLTVRGGRARLLALSSQHSVAVVGSRVADSEGTRLAHDLSRDICAAGAVIVSGLAFGIDAAAHRGALAAKGVTIAVLGNGLATVYPAAHEPLASAIIAGGGVLLSEYEPDTRAYPSNFLERNRIIAGICVATVVIQAARRSGALATARFCREQNRELLVVPGSVRAALFEGSHELLKQGAYLCTTSSDVIEHLPGLVAPTVTQRSGTILDPVILDPVTLDPGLKDLLLLLADGSPHLIQDFGAIARLHERVIELELADLIEQLPGDRIQLTGAGLTSVKAIKNNDP